jgi:hypothetical protein
MDDAMRESLNAFVDGELPPKEMERIAALLAGRPELAAYVAAQENLRATLKMPDILAGASPRHLVDAIYQSPVSWRWRLRSVATRGFTVRMLAPAGAALSLGLVIGVALHPAGDLAMADGQVVARGALGAALDTKLASAGYDGQGARIGISFHNQAGEACRTFTSGDSAGLACHRAGAWIVGTMVTQAPESTGLYRMAGSQMPAAVRQAVANSIAGAPFDAATEARAKAQGWTGK